MRGKEVIIDSDLSRSLGIFVDGMICREIDISSERVDTKLFRMKITGEVRKSLRTINIKRHPTISAYQKFIAETGLRLHIRFNIKGFLRLLGLHKRSASSNSLNDIVDAVNLSTFIPLKVFDLRKVRYPLIIRYSIEGESFRNLKGVTWILKGSEVVLSDSNNNLIALLPYWIGFDYAIKPGLKRDIALMAFGVRGVPKSMVIKAVKFAEQTIRSYYPESPCFKLRIYQ